MKRSETVRQWCGPHWDPIYRGSVAGKMNSTAAAILLGIYALNNPTLQGRAGGDIAMMNVLMAEVGPLCCFLGDEVMDRLYRQIRIVGDAMPDMPGSDDNPYTVPEKWSDEG